MWHDRKIRWMYKRGSSDMDREGVTQLPESFWCLRFCALHNEQPHDFSVGQHISHCARASRDIVPEADTDAATEQRCGSITACTLHSSQSYVRLLAASHHAMDH